MNRTFASIFAFAFAATLSAGAIAKPKSHTEYARVTHVEPVYKQVKHRVPKESCWVETVREERPVHQRRSATPTIIGGIVGGVIGNEIGQGHNKRLGSVVGSVLGMSIANDIQHKKARDKGQYRVSYRDVERCETSYHVEHERVLRGYNVNYRYQGREYSTFTNQHPGKKIRIAVNVRPVSH